MSLSIKVFELEFFLALCPEFQGCQQWQLQEELNGVWNWFKHAYSENIIMCQADRCVWLLLPKQSMPARLSGSGCYVRKAGGGLASCRLLVLSYTLLTVPGPLPGRASDTKTDSPTQELAALLTPVPCNWGCFCVFCVCFLPCYRYKWQPLWRLSAICVCPTPQTEHEGGPIVHPLPVLGMGSLFWNLNSDRNQLDSAHFTDYIFVSYICWFSSVVATEVFVDLKVLTATDFAAFCSCGGWLPVWADWHYFIYRFDWQFRSCNVRPSYGRFPYMTV